MTDSASPGWSNPKTASGVVAVFILCNSLAGLGGNIASVHSLPENLPLFEIDRRSMTNRGSGRHSLYCATSRPLHLSCLSIG